MENGFDQLAKVLAAGGGEEGNRVPRREALGRVGRALGAALIGSLGMGTAWAAKGGQNGGGNGGNSPCANYCRRFPTKGQQDACLRACHGCPTPTMLCGTSAYDLVCCAGTCCSGACKSLATDPANCGTCGANCGSFPNVNVTCSNGTCYYACAPGWADCDGYAANGCETYIARDANNCGACGYVCGGETPYCSNGACSPCPPGQILCGDGCVQALSDASNCGGCGNLCDTDVGQVCCWGTCMDYCSCYDCSGEYTGPAP